MSVSANGSARPVRVVFCWAEVSGYIASCFRALARHPGVELHVLHPERLLDRPNPFDVGPLLHGISHEMFSTERPDVDAYLLETIARHDPDVIVICGWIYWPYTRLINAPRLRRSKMLLGMDTPWQATLPQRFARWRLGHFTRALDLVVTASDRSSEYARRIGVPESRIRPGFYGFDDRSFSEAATHRPKPWPRRFLFAGRYVPEKDLQTLVRGYERYRASVQDPWTLTCSGAGPDADVLKNAAGVVDAGFAQPKDLPALFRDHGAFVLPSRFEPWGVVIGEAAAAGLPIICTSSCGAAVDLVRPYYNGVVIPPADPDALARAMKWVHDHESQAPLLGQRGQSLAAAFAADAWAERWYNYMLESLDAEAARS